MRRILLSLFICTAMFSACNKLDNVTEEAVAVNDLPAAVTESAQNNYPDAVIYSASRLINGGADYIITLNTQEEAAFKANGEHLGDGARFHAPIGGRPHGGGFNPRGLMNGHHDGDHDRGHQGCGHGVGGHHGHELPIDSLPSAIPSYITTNYAGFTIRHAELDSLCSVGGIINVAISQAGAPPVRLIFSTTGTYLMKGQRADYANAPQVVKDYISTNYAGFTVRHRAIQLTLANGNLQYMVFLRQNQLHKNVLMNADGTFVCEH